MARTETYNLLIAHSGLDEAIAIYNKNADWMWKKMAPVISTQEAYWRALQYSDFSIAPSVGQSQPLPMEDFETPYFKDFFPVKRALTSGVSTETLMSDRALYKIVAQTGTMLNKSVNKAFEVEASAFMNLATATDSASTGPDGVALASASHPYIGGTTTNILTSNPVLSQAALETARTALIQQLSHKGDPMMYNGPFDLFVPPALISIADRAVGAATYGVAGVNTGTALGNDPNVMGTSRVRVVCNPWFTNTTAWFLRCRNEEDHGLRLISRRMPTTKVWDDERTDSVITGVTGIICRAVRDWRGLVYSSGAGS